MRYRTGQSTRDLHFKHESEQHMSASAGNRTRAACVTGEHATIKPPMKTHMNIYELSIGCIDGNMYKLSVSYCVTELCYVESTFIFLFVP